MIDLFLEVSSAIKISRELIDVFDIKIADTVAVAGLHDQVYEHDLYEKLKT